MKRAIIALLISLPAILTGCAAQAGLVGPMRQPYLAGDTVLLMWTPEVSYRMSGTAIVDRAIAEMVVSVSASGESNQVFLKVSTRRAALVKEATGENGQKSVTMDDSNQPGKEDVQKNIRSLAASARAGSTGQLTILNSHGLPIDLTKGFDGVPLEDRDSLFFLQPLTDSLAYLPPPGTAVGQGWTVHLQNVLPGRAGEYAMMTGGAPCNEESFCTCERIEFTGAGRVAVISVSGTRKPQYRLGVGKPIISLSVRGELRFNLDAGRIEKLRIESLPQWADPNYGNQWQMKFVDTLSTEALAP